MGVRDLLEILDSRGPIARLDHTICIASLPPPKEGWGLLFDHRLPEPKLVPSTTSAQIQDIFDPSLLDGTWQLHGGMGYQRCLYLPIF